MSRSDIPRIGLIAREERARGLAIQSKGFYDHMPVDRILVVDMPQPDGLLAEGWYPNATHLPSLPGHTLDETKVRDWMDGLDVVFTVETPYDWSLPRWAREMNVRTVIQGNPEFVRHGLPDFDHYEHPDEWWWPTSWRVDRLPPGRWMPVPMPDHERTAASIDGPVRFYHVTGKRAFADRNGTDIVLAAIRGLRDCRFTIYGLDHCLPDVPAVKGLDLVVDNIGVEDRWDLHVGHHVLVMPRRYGGLCLPALEAASRGMAVMMPDISPNTELASLLIGWHEGWKINVAAGQIPTHDVNQYQLGQYLTSLSRNPQAVADAMTQSWEMVPRWSEWRDQYLNAFRELI